MPLLIGLLSFISVSLLVYELLRPRSNAVARRASGSSSGNGVSAVDRTQGSVTQRLLKPFVARWGNRLSQLLPQNFVAGIDRMLTRAAQPWSLAGFLFAWALSTGFGLALFYYFAFLTADLTLLQTVLVGLLTVPLFAILPYMYLRSKVKRRQKLIVRALPDAMDLLVTSIEAGLGIDAAFALVAEKTSGPLSDTISTYLRSVGFGRSRREALQEATEATGVQQLMGIAYAVNQAEQLGSTLGDVLRVQADDLRVARRQRAESAAQRAPVLMTIPLVACFLPAMGAVVLVPSILNLVYFVSGDSGPGGGGP
jgi:tight adherence protein C